MSLEDQVARLANAIGMHDDVAVREIIRQRDAALKDAAHYKSKSERLDAYSSEQSSRLWRLERKNSALRGVITRMKRGR